MAVHVAVMTIVIGVIVVQSNNLFSARLNREFNHDLAEEGPEFANASANRPRGQPLADFARLYLSTHLLRSGQTLIIALGAPGHATLLHSSGGARIASDPVVTALLARPGSSTSITGLTLGAAQYRVVTSPIRAAGRRVGTLVAVRDLAGLTRDRLSELTIAALEGLAALIAAVLAGYVLLRRVLRVVSDVTSAAELATDGDLGTRLAYDGPDDEVGHLARTFDAMLARLDQAFSAQRRLLSDVSHQLRTPLTVIRGHLEVLARNPVADPDEQAETIALVVDEIEHLSLMVDRLLLLGRALEPDFVDEEPIDVRSLLEDVMDAAQHLAPRAWELDAAIHLVIRGDRTKLRGALLNLIDNAVNATTEADTIRLSAACDSADEVVFAVTDTGCGLSADQQQRMFERFARSTDRYRGTGLGLAIVKAVAEAHGGSVAIHGAPDTGCTVTVILPGHRIELTQSALAVT
jgi:two-component system OmpR family sensor kinase